VFELFTQGGLLAASIFLWLVVTTLFKTYKARQAGLTTLLCGLVLFGMTVFILRDPILWFAIALCLVAGAGTGGRDRGRKPADGVRGVAGVPRAGRIALWQGRAAMADGRRRA
jgi:hypothetical protein